MQVYRHAIHARRRLGFSLEQMGKTLIHCSLFGEAPLTFTDQPQCTAYSFMASLGPYVFPARFGHVYCSSCWIWRSSEASFPCCWSCGEPTSAWILVHAPKPAAPKLVPFSIISAVQSSGPTVQVQPGSSYGYGSQPIYQVISPVSANWMFGGNNNNNNAVNGTYPALPSNIALNGTIPPRIAPPNPHAVTHAHRTIYTSAIRSTIPSSTTTASQAYRINAETFPLTFGPARLYHPRSNLTDPLPTRSASCLPTPTPSNSTSTPGLSSSTSSPTTNNSNNTQTPPSPSNSKPPKRYQVQFIDWPTLVEREGKLQAVQFLVRIMARALGNGLVERAEEGGWEVVFE